MYKLMIIDDEPYIVEGLNNYDWESLNIKVTKTCENGYEAMNYLESEPVDIILTDINMPIMSGLEIIAEVNKKYPFIYTVVLTGYSDFNYAKKCIQYNVMDYLLKPVNLIEMKKTFSILIKRMDEEKQQQLKQSILEKQVRSAVKILRNDFLKRILNHSIEEEEILENASYGELILESENYTVCLYKPDSYERFNEMSKDEQQTAIYALDKVFDNLCSSKEIGYYWINREVAEGYLLITNDEIQQEESTKLAVLNELKKKLNSLRGIIMATMSCGVGKPVQELKKIYQSAKQARVALQSKVCEYEIINYNDRMSIIESNNDSQQFLNKDGSTLKSETEYCMRDDNHIIVKAKEYINQNYQQSITLSDVSNQVFVSPEYLSSLFREVTKIKFIDYLTMCRVEKAKELLYEPKYKVYEVCTLVGYENSRYFSSVFRKYVGKSPTEFRNNILNKKNI